MQHPVSLKKRQHGLTMFGFLFGAVVLVLVAMVAMKVVPAYVEFFSVKKILNAMAQEANLRDMSNSEIRNDFAKRADVSYVTVVKPGDIAVNRSGGVPVVSVDYEVRTKLVGNVDLVLDFSASTNPRSAPVQVE